MVGRLQSKVTEESGRWQLSVSLCLAVTSSWEVVTRLPSVGLGSRWAGQPYPTSQVKVQCNAKEKTS